jgi:nitrile hydratase accessory protein
MTRALTVELDLDGPAAPPRSNGELVFAQPWESRAFGLVMALHNAGAFGWDEFRKRLIARIEAWEYAARPGECFNYYRCWVDALEDVLVAKVLVADGAVDERAADLAARPAGWDHGHEHGDHEDHDHHH